jgi:hypothetical protein
MPNEVVYQRYLVTSIKEHGGFALKMSNAYMVGIPDLLLKCRDWPQPQIWEVKREQDVKWVLERSPPRPVRLDTTQLQRKTLRDMGEAGIQVAILLILPGPGRSVTVALTRDIAQTHMLPQEFNRCHYEKTLKQTWHDAVMQLNQLVPPK